MTTNMILGSLLTAILFVFVGLTVFHFVFRLAAKSAVAAFREEIIEKQNSAAAILVGLVSIGLSIIIAAAVH